MGIGATQETPQWVTSVDELVAIVPTLLGFRPEESLVMVGVKDNQMEMVCRADLADVLHDKPFWEKLINGIRSQFTGMEMHCVAVSADPQLFVETGKLLQDTFMKPSASLTLAAMAFIADSGQNNSGLPTRADLARRYALPDAQRSAILFDLGHIAALNTQTIDKADRPATALGLLGQEHPSEIDLAQLGILLNDDPTQVEYLFQLTHENANALQGRLLQLAQQIEAKHTVGAPPPAPTI
ncbi:MAG: DUF4192 domain-containing protein [Propionibacteriaceae bacterium]|jgi:hypothetical protein|nr:DUF4192 domain-containing protein [Propionibacteriaceae bacterium]